MPKGSGRPYTKGEKEAVGRRAERRKTAKATGDASVLASNGAVKDILTLSDRKDKFDKRQGNGKSGKLPRGQIDNKG